MASDVGAHPYDEATQFTCFGDDLTQMDDDATYMEEAELSTNSDEDYRPLEVGSLFLGRYKILKVLGSGNFGMIYLLEANDASKKLLVAKEFFPKGYVVRGVNDNLVIKSSLSEKELKNFYFMKNIFIGEAQNLVKVTHKSHHPNIVTFFALEEERNNTTYFIMNYEKGISLKEYLSEKEGERLSNKEIYRIIIPLLSGLGHIHQAGVYHQDIKLDNILIREDDTPLLLDFGASVILYDDEAGRYFNAATPRYAAIEQINVDNPPKINQTSDIYAVGVLLHRLITGDFPPKSKERLDAIVKGQKDPYKHLASQRSGSYDKQLLQAADTALRIPQEERFQSAEEFIDALGNKKKIKLYLFSIFVLLASLIYIFMPNKTGKVKFNIAYKGYQIYIDGKKTMLDQDKTAILESGKHRIVVTKDGYIPFEKTFKVKENSIANIAVDLAPAQQVVTIETDVEDATIVLNGRTLKGNTFTAKYGGEYSLKIIAKDRETVKKNIDYKTLFESDFKLYYKLPVSKCRVELSVNMPIQMGVTKIKVNNEAVRDGGFVALKGKSYKITIENPYYEPITVERTFKELFNVPQQKFDLLQGEGSITLHVKPDNANAEIYHLIEGQEMKLHAKPYKINGATTINTPSSDKIFLIVSKEGYKKVRSRIFAVKNGANITKNFQLSAIKATSTTSSMAQPDTVPYQHEMVKVPGKNFSISKYEVSYEAFARFLNASKIAKRNLDKNGNKLYGSKIFKYILHKPNGYIVSRNYKEYPINYITWYGANLYTQWLSKQLGHSYSLPSEKEWTEVAKLDYSADKLDQQANYNSGIVLQKGSKSPGNLGIYDLFGNLFEWTSTSSGSSKHIIKGGSYRSKRTFLLPHKSSSEYNTNNSRRDLGFRIIRKN